MGLWGRGLLADFSTLICKMCIIIELTSLGHHAKYLPQCLAHKGACQGLRRRTNAFIPRNERCGHPSGKRRPPVSESLVLTKPALLYFSLNNLKEKPKPGLGQQAPNVSIGTPGRACENALTRRCELGPGSWFPASPGSAEAAGPGGRALGTAGLSHPNRPHGWVSVWLDVRLPGSFQNYRCLSPAP